MELFLDGFLVPGLFVAILPILAGNMSRFTDCGVCRFH
jgi:hypothetical protein